MAFVLIPLVVITGFAAVVVAVAVRADGRNMVTGLASVCFLLLFFNTGMVPLEVFPEWLQPVVRPSRCRGHPDNACTCGGRSDTGAS